MANVADMPTSLAAVQAAGAMSLELPPEFQSAGRVEGALWGKEVTQLTPMGSPLAASTPGTCGTNSFNFMGSPYAASSPMVAFGMPPSPAGMAVQQQQKSQMIWCPRSPVPMSPAFYAQAPAACMSPGAEIRQNAASLGIPLNLHSSPEDVYVPIPVRTTSGAVVAPSPVNRGNIEAQRFLLGGDSVAMVGVAPTLPAVGAPQVVPSGMVHAAPTYTTATGPLGFPVGAASLQQIRGIAMPSRAGVPRSGGA